MARIWIFGDSFAASSNPLSWTQLLKQHTKVITRAHNGSSEHRIWKCYQGNKELIRADDIVIFCHTSPSRVYLKNSSSSLSRLLPSHPWCDLIFNDVFAKKEHKFIKILKEIWDEEYFQDTYNLYRKDLEKVPRSIHIDFFSPGFYNTTWKENTGRINHMDRNGNMLVFKKIEKELPCV